MSKTTTAYKGFDKAIRSAKVGTKGIKPGVAYKLSNDGARFVEAK